MVQQAVDIRDLRTVMHTSECRSLTPTASRCHMRRTTLAPTPEMVTPKVLFAVSIVTVVFYYRWILLKLYEDFGHLLKS